MTEDEREHETAKRLDAFVDAAFAFAVTLLVIAGAEGPPSLAALGAAMGRIPASLGAFVLIAMFWMAYRDFGRIAPRRDAWASLNGLAIVFVVLVYVFPLRMLLESGFVWISGGRLPGEVIIHILGDLRMLFRVYGMGFVVLAGLFVTLFAHAARSPEKLGVNAADAAMAASVAQIWIIVASGGLLSALLTFAPLQFAPWLPGMAYWAIPLGIGARSLILSRATRARARAAKTD
ncbi:TMEM175 family protein [Caulobacter sp. ErkDOM-YI]|uniref:TMEM175 family protein n=1 Tax=unclassified Caulobacter TaxID=2648921 RepID=UPI003AF6E73B